MSMGQCLSPCCEKQGLNSPVSSIGDTGHPNHSRTQYLAGIPVSDSKENCAEPNPPVTTPNSEWKMFTPYPKLPPIKKQGVGVETKRLSLMSNQVFENKILSLFDNYKDKNEDCILADGIERLCMDLEVKPEEFIVLVLAWKFGAETMCEFKRSEFVQGCKALKVDSLRGIQSKFPELLVEVRDKQAFKDLYRWTYKFGLDSASGQRTLPTDMAISLWKLVFSQNEPLVLQRWLEFLEKHTSIRGIPKDTWDMFLNFTEQVGEDLSSYDDTEAWPSLLDDFVEFENDRHNQNVTAD
ncbi:DCN1-like protein 3 [Biomphalaria glabrata]|uniref:Defective in cullin neddylation protein n=1 Tax=Biomphalaria glabrata TaxID=6526 RepID=A0A2C9JFR8_BIOGL|nr:DCN1-like protein 3 [Biomphalaria glabrata]KAI8765602.1 DCN1-like protein 3 [Biomphalaria glabrata]